MDRETLATAVVQARGRIVDIASALEVSRNQVYGYLRRLGLEATDRQARIRIAEAALDLGRRARMEDEADVMSVEALKAICGRQATESAELAYLRGELAAAERALRVVTEKYADLAIEHYGGLRG